MDRHSSKHRDEQGTAARAKRTRRRRPRRILGLWARLALLTVFIGMLTAVAAALVAKAIRPYREASIQSSLLADSNRQIQNIDAENASLRRRISYLQTSEGEMSEARKMGYLRPGEIPIVVEGAATPWSDAPAQPSPSPAQNDFRDRARNFWRSLTGLRSH